MDLQAYALQLARPAFCEVQLLKFLAQVKLVCVSQQDVDELFTEWRKPKEKAKPLKIISGKNE